jgi:(E)-4-hydroxy-3-methylbut-2-enyl-diphosphate synthase
MFAYVEDPFSPRRRATREVCVGEVRVGAKNPIRIQSMTTTDTCDVAATADQLERLADAGCEIGRVTVPSIRDAEALVDLRAELSRRRVTMPLVADIHFTPNAALLAAEHVEKVRINPGNFADKKKFEIREYSDAQYARELERIAERVRPLVRRLRELGRALRIGTNHGSLSDRVMNRFGDTPLGMVESALEFLAVCEDEGLHDVIFSMKASNPQVTVQAYRLLAARLSERAPGAPSYPFHLGVTEAGDGEDGRIKSAIGIGALLEDGLGDTIRVSLTEDPVREVPVARELARRYDARFERQPAARAVAVAAPFTPDPIAHVRRSTRASGGGSFGVGGANPVRAQRELGPVPEDPGAAALELLQALRRAEPLVCEGLRVDAADPAASARVPAYADALVKRGIEAPLAVRAPAELVPTAARASARAVARIEAQTASDALEAAASFAASCGRALEWSLAAPIFALPELVDRALAATRAAGLSDALMSVDGPTLPVHAVRVVAAQLAARGARLPIVLRGRFDPALDADAALLHAATDLGAPLCDGIGDAVAVAGFGAPDRALDVVYRTLQGARLRTTRTEFISCPSCGRTLFDLEETTARIKARTAHLRDVKIAIMGCIVNGPGEMADADFGYVGSGPGLVNLYVGKELVARHVPQERADDQMVDLIRERGRWVDPPESSVDPGRAGSV